jgi:hypothetical protein
MQDGYCRDGSYAVDAGINVGVIVDDLLNTVPISSGEKSHGGCATFWLLLIRPCVTSVLSHKFIELKASPIVSRIVQTIRGENDERPTKGGIDFE